MNFNKIEEVQGFAEHAKNELGLTTAQIIPSLIEFCLKDGPMSKKEIISTVSRMGEFNTGQIAVLIDIVDGSFKKTNDGKYELIEKTDDNSPTLM